MFCGGCGARIPEGAAFCPACGLKVDESYCAGKDEKGLSKRQAFGIAFLATFLGSVPGVPLGLLAAVASVPRWPRMKACIVTCSARTRTWL